MGEAVLENDVWKKKQLTTAQRLKQRLRNPDSR
jgi:hypothetical protein